MSEGDNAHAYPAVVGIGASAGGIEAFQGFFENMPPDSGLAFVVVLHLPTGRASALSDILGRWTAMPVAQVVDGCPVEPNHVYLPPPGVGLVLREGRLHPVVPAADAPREPSPISMFFDSLAHAQGEDAIGVVLSGTGNDGALGLKAIKLCGGLTLSQGADGTKPRYEGMPESAIATGAVDIVAPVEEMPAHILAVRRARRPADAALAPQGRGTDAARLAVCAILQRQLGHDFSRYKDKTFLRRVSRRMQVTRLETLDAYIACLESDRAEVVMLFRDLLIGVTSFFRDGETFEVLGREVIPALFDRKDAQDSIRIWVAGCATGEEAYSLAILLRERMDRLEDEATQKGVPRVQIFATDIDEAAIATARAGRYPSTLLEGMSPARLTRFFTADDGGYTVVKELRALCTFSTHSLTRDPPFSKVDLVSCRNLLIYLDMSLQAAVMPAFHYSLVPGGILLLGSSENITRHEGLFETLDRAHRIFRRREVPTPPLRLETPPGPEKTRLMKNGAAPAPSRQNTSRLGNRAGARVLERFAPAFVVVDEAGEVIQFSNHTGRFLEAPSGVPSRNLLDLARRGLRAPLRAGLRLAAETGRPVENLRVSVEVPGEGTQRITLAVEPLPDSGPNPAWLVVFVEAARHGGGRRRSKGAAVETADHDRHLESELRDTLEQLQSITEEHDTAVEELRSANEELHSVNEELQSTNEELETSKEEIQSINEELQTVNAQLAAKVDELDGKNADLQNLFESTQVATIFLDVHCVIRGFTPAVANLYNLIPSDQGRPLTDIASRLRYNGLRDDMVRVLASLEPLERRVAHEDDATHYLMRMLPYRAPDNAVDGAVVTFVDVTTMVRSEQHQRLLVDELNHRVKNMLTVVISMATQTLRRSDSLETFSKNYLGRVHALAASYSLLSSEAWKAVSLRALAMGELGPFASEERGNVVLSGPLVPLEPRAALALGMALHEMTTNAVKYGALSVPGGIVTLTWNLERDIDADADRLILEWIESGGPRVDPPSHRGFGTMLIERGLRQDMSAEVEMDFTPDGVRARFTAPLRPVASFVPNSLS